MSNKAMAQTSMVSIRTIESHVSHALMKTGCRSRLELVLWWQKQTRALHGQPISKLPPMPA
ncbi:MAG: response regulator transcription factor [Synechococcus sp.]